METMELRTVLSKLPLDERQRVIDAHVKRLLDAMLPTEELRFGQLMEMLWPHRLAGKKDPLRAHLKDIVMNAVNQGRLDGYWHKSPVGVQGTSVCAGKLIYPKLFHALRNPAMLPNKARHFSTAGKEYEPTMQAVPVHGQVKITIEGGCLVSVEGLPPGWDYELHDLDNAEADPSLEFMN